MNKAIDNYDWRVSMIFSVDLNEINLKPGSGQLPEEIVMRLNRCGDEISLTPLSEAESVRQYLVTTNIRSPESPVAINALKHQFSCIPSFCFVSARATIVERIE